MPLILALTSFVMTFLSPAELFPQLAPYHLQQVILFPAIAATLAAWAMRTEGLRMPEDGLMIGLWFAVCVSLLTRFMLRDGWNAFLTFALAVCVYFLVAANAFTIPRIRAIGLVLSLTAILIALQGIFAYHFRPGSILVLERLGTGFQVSRRLRGYGILNDPNDLAQFLLVGLALLGQFWNKQQKLFSLIVLGVPACILVYAINLTGSRGAVFGLAVVLAVVASGRFGSLQSLVLGVALLGVLVLSQFGGGREMSLHEASAGQRINAWGAGIQMLESNPLFGVGFSRFNDVYPDITAHNSFVLCFAELGFFGYFFWLALLISAIRGMHRVVKLSSDQQVQRTVSSIRAALLGFVATAWFLSRTYSPTLYILLGLAIAVVHLRQRENPKLELVPRRWIAVTLALQCVSVIAIYLTIRVRGL